MTKRINWVHILENMNVREYDCFRNSKKKHALTALKRFSAHSRRKFKIRKCGMWPEKEFEITRTH